MSFGVKENIILKQTTWAYRIKEAQNRTTNKILDDDFILVLARSRLSVCRDGTKEHTGWKKNKTTTTTRAIGRIAPGTGYTCVDWY